MDTAPEATTLEEWIVAFCDEDTATWTTAARAIGKQAAADAEALEFIQQRLKEAPAAGDDQEPPRGYQDTGLRRRSGNVTRTNLHRYRRACCAAAAYLSEPDTTEEPFGGLIDEILRKPLRTLRDEKDSASTDLTQQEQDQAWTLGSYLLGVRHPKALPDISPEELTETLLAQAQRGGSAGLVYVLSLPTLLQAIQEHVPDKQWAATAELLFENLHPAWIRSRLEYNQYVLDVSRLKGAPPFRELWTSPLDLPGWLTEGLEELQRLAGEESDAFCRAAARRMRAIAGGAFGDDWEWKERPDGEQFALNVHALLMLQGPEVLGASESGKELNLQHRLSLLMDGIAAAGRARSGILPTLVGCLKELLHREWTAFFAARPAKRNDYETLQELMSLARRQLLMVKPMLNDRLLPASLRKDLAAIVCRILHCVYRFQEDHRDQLVEDRKEFREYTVELVYMILFAFPDNLLLREMIEYSTDDDLCRLFDCIRQLIEQFERYEEARALLVSERQKRAHFEIEAESWKRRYDDFATLLGCISLHSLSDQGEHWLNFLRRMIGHLTRSDREEFGEDHTPAEAPLWQLLRYGLKSQQDWRELLDQTQSRPDDHSGVKEQQREWENRLRLTAQSRAGEFMGLLDDIQILEHDCLPEIGRPRMGDDLVPRWRRLIHRMTELGRLCDEHLPWLERVLTTRIIHHRINAILEPRLQQIVEIVDQEREEDAQSILAEHVKAQTSGKSARPESAGKSIRDVGLIENWMLRRYMIRELAKTYGLTVLSWLTNGKFVAGWILLPFLLAGVLNLAGAKSFTGIPFALLCLANFGLLIAYALQSRRRQPDIDGTMVSPWGFMLPQTAAAIFLAVTTALPTDEGWSIAVSGNPWVQMFTWAAYLAFGFLFTREIILGEQFQGRKESRQKNRRAMQLMALSLWQSFALVMFFAMVYGRVMAGETRAAVDIPHSPGLGVVPNVVYLGPWFLQPASDSTAAFWIFPRAILTWTVQMFFFGAIFERVMRKSGD
ncbi:MAG: hypothetical protein JXA11_07045 [Phycisphaerae bacterium]|nr:hypothetical protein [Phycisphaerae bacterium]